MLVFFTFQGYKKLKDFSFSQLRIANISFLAHKARHEKLVEKKGLQTVGCYDILAQPKYKELLQYVPHAYRSNQGQEYSFSDQLRRYIDFPYLKKD